ncbi:p53-like transcription factor [Metschnikowia bicuspidata]|uniref:p53-like transcription factor n=1 Tax=Metschnikowia bicuspidata TaxID=27322 RepID=A0A4P9ZDZ3_9ASCO|nr:p53-like transcription factor [Metschnikowia bicuspidata]
MGKVKFPRLESANFRETDKFPGPPGGHPHKRLAPRSGNQFRIGPPFGSTCSQNQLFLPSREILEPVIEARIDRGFDYINGTWVGYKRNYFGAVVGFRFAGVTNEAALDLHILCCGPDTKGKTKMVKLFRIQLRAECTESPQRKVALVQHTAKRDNGPQTEPPIFNIIPGVLPSHNVIRQISNIRNGAKVSSSNRLFHYDEVDRGLALKRHQNGILKNYPRGEHVTVAGRYDRIQFQYAGAKLEKGFFLKVVLTAVLEGGAEIEIASAQTPSLVVRGRSPSSYKLDPPKADYGRSGK